MADVLLKIEEGPADHKPASPKVEDFIELARKRFRVVAETEGTLREEQLEDKKFRSSDQWPDEIKTDRQQDGRPCLTINRLNQFIKQVTNQQRASRPSITVHPIDDKGDIETAEVFQGLIRHIETRSDADIAYAVAGENQAEIGRGYWRVITEWEHERAVTQEIRIKRIRNPFYVYMDPAYSEFDGRDARFAFIIEDVPKEMYRMKYGDASLKGLEEFQSTGDFGESWMPEGKVRIAEYFYVTLIDEKIIAVLRPDGQIEGIEEKELDKLVEADADLQGTPVRELQRVGERPGKRREVRHAIINGVEILRGNKEKNAGGLWPGKWIPIVPVIGDEIDVNGRVDYRGIVRDARDPQRMFNYWESALTEAIALSPKAPWVIAKGQVEGFESKWNTANKRNWPYLEYNPIDSAGNAVGPPQRQVAEPPIQALIAATQQADFDLKAVTGFHDPSLGSMSANERSGKAILALQKQGEMANSHFLDNMSRAIRFTGRILVDLIPKIYDTPRIMRILGDDEKPRTVMVGSNGQNPQEEQKPDGVEAIFDLSVGNYDVAVSVGPSFQSRRQEVTSTVQDLVKAYPDIFPVLGDLLIGAMEIPIGQQIAKRIKRWSIQQGVLPPEMEGDQEMPPEAAAMIQQLQGQLEKMGEEMQAMQSSIEVDETKARAQHETKAMEIESKEKIAKLDSTVELAIAQLKAGQEEQANQMKTAQVEMQEANKQVLETMKAIVATNKQKSDNERQAAKPAPKS